MKISWWRHHRTGLAHAFEEGKDRSLCCAVEFADMGKKNSRGSVLRCKMCLKTLGRMKLRAREEKRRRSVWRRR